MNPVFQLATRAGNIGPPRVFSRLVPPENVIEQSSYTCGCPLRRLFLFRTIGASWEECAYQLGGRRTMNVHSCEPNYATIQNENIAKKKKIPLYKATTLRIFVTPFFNGLVVSFPNYCSTVQKKWKRINCAEIRRNKLRTFFSNEKTSKFRCIYCSNVREISQSRWWTDTGFHGIRRNFISKFRAMQDENSCHWKEISSAETKFRFQKFLSAYRIQL